MIIRAAVEGDLAEILRVERGAATAPHWGVGEYEGIVAAQRQTQVPFGDDKQKYNGVRRCLLVAYEGGVVGFAVGKVVAGEGEVESVAVEAVAQRRGVGAALLGAVLAWCKGEGAGVVDLEVRAGSEGAQRLYERAGFVEMGRRPGYYSGPVEDAVLMRVVFRVRLLQAKLTAKGAEETGPRTGRNDRSMTE